MMAQHLMIHSPRCSGVSDWARDQTKQQSARANWAEQSKRLSNWWKGEWVNERASGLVLSSRSLVFLDHSATRRISLGKMRKAENLAGDNWKFQSGSDLTARLSPISTQFTRNNYLCPGKTGKPEIDLGNVSLIFLLSAFLLFFVTLDVPISLSSFFPIRDIALYRYHPFYLLSIILIASTLFLIASFFF